MRFLFVAVCRFVFSLLVSLFSLSASAQLRWQTVDSAYGPLPPSVHIYFTQQAVDTAPFRAFYFVADLKDRKLDFTTDTTLNRRLTPSQFFAKNSQPLVVVNGTFFSFETNRNLNVVVKDGRVVSHNLHTIAGRGRDTLTYRHPFAGAIGISKKRKADVAWTFADSSKPKLYASQTALLPLQDSFVNLVFETVGPKAWRKSDMHQIKTKPVLAKWKMQTAIGGGPVLLQRGETNITNNEELKFTGKAINDKHPRTAMGYTADNKLIILVVEGRNAVAHGATLQQEAQILKDLGCVEALNLDGGGSSCLLVNGKQTILPADKGVQRPVPAVFLIREK